VPRCRCGEYRSSEFYSERHNKCKSCMKKQKTADYRKAHPPKQVASGSTKMTYAQWTVDYWYKKCSYKYPTTHEVDVLLGASNFYLEPRGVLHGYCYECQKDYNYRRYHHSTKESSAYVEPRTSVAITSPYVQVMKAIADLPIDGPVAREDLERILTRVCTQRNMPIDSNWPRDYLISA
jgi:hypothetical protein